MCEVCSLASNPAWPRCRVAIRPCQCGALALSRSRYWGRCYAPIPIYGRLWNEAVAKEGRSPKPRNRRIIAGNRRNRSRESFGNRRIMLDQNFASTRPTKWLRFHAMGKPDRGDLIDRHMVSNQYPPFAAPPTPLDIFLFAQVTCQPRAPRDRNVTMGPGVSYAAKPL